MKEEWRFIKEKDKIPQNVRDVYDEVLKCNSFGFYVYNMKVRGTLRTLINLDL